MTRGGATRMRLLRARRRLAVVERGVELLRRKREALAEELFRLARPAVDARARITEAAERAYPALLRGLALHGEAGLAVLAWPERLVALDIETRRIWGTTVAEIVRRGPLVRTLTGRGTSPAGTGPAAASAQNELERMLELTLDAAPRETMIRRLGDALSRTSRQIHALEDRVAPELRAEVATVRRTLEERERDEHARLKRLKSKGLDETINMC
ncbi:MAG: V-type ATP synthase subunit D [Gemmatimonadetes bacterium]|nr:V-type ATP synthase subunit D [Gemmatimonadota bacterium]